MHKLTRPFLFGLFAAILISQPGAAQDMANLSSFKDCDHCPEMVVIAPGEFMMGASRKDAAVPFVSYSLPGEKPRHKVTIGYKFAIGKFEVTVGEVRQFAKETGTSMTGRCLIRLADSGPQRGKYKGTLHPDTRKLKNTPNLVIIADGSFKQPGLKVTDLHPATCISRPEAKAYLAWLSKKSNRQYRLATEAEWEYAARAGTNSAFFWGRSVSQACRYANFADRSSYYQAKVMAKCRDKVKSLWAAPKGSYRPNPWGIHDTAGNIQEMLEDCWHVNYRGAPKDGSPWMDRKCDHYIARGGDYELMVGSMRSAERLFYGIEHGQFDRYNVLGFRAAVSLSNKAWDKK